MKRQIETNRVSINFNQLPLRHLPGGHRGQDDGRFGKLDTPEERESIFTANMR